MVPEMALGYVIGWIPSAIVTGLHFRLHRKKVGSAAYRQLQQNLQKANLIWRESQGVIEPYREGKEEQDLKSYEKNLILMGTFFLFLSWGGFFFNLIMLFSIHLMAISRFERRIFASPLAEKDLPANVVNQVLEEVEDRGV